MAEFYGFPHWILTALVMIIALGIVLQTQTFSYSIRRLHTGWIRTVENAMEFSILIMLFVFAALLAQVQYALFCEFIALSAYHIYRQMVFLLSTVISITVAVETEKIWPFFTVCAAVVLLPITEKITGTVYPVFFLFSILFFMMRSIHISLIRQREIRTQISSMSIKETIDTLNTGLLFFRSDGSIILCNNRMNMLAQQITGQVLQNGRVFQMLLEYGILFDGCTREVLSGQQVFRLPDSSVWSISLHDIYIKHKKLILMTADDVTERWDAMMLLDYQNQMLEKRGEELRQTIEQLQTICEAEEIARSKGRVHDILGQRISLLLRAMRDNQQPDETLLMDFIHNLPTALREEEMQSPAHRLKMLKETFQGMDVSVEIQGELPEDIEVAYNFAEIAVECVTNAVRHGYATRVQLHFFQNSCWRMTVMDNGIPPVEPIREGGGISEMRRRIDRLGGTLELYTVPRFSIQIFVPKEEVQICSKFL